jgi:hypothetical protein
MAPERRSISSERRPRSLTRDAARSNTSLAWSTFPASACASASQKVQRMKDPSSPSNPPSPAYRSTGPAASVSAASIASMVSSTSGSMGGRSPTVGMISAEASSASEPRNWVKAPTFSFHPRSRMEALISARAVDQAGTLSDACRRSAIHRTIQRHPAHQLEVRVVTGIAAHLPDPLVALDPHP